MNKRALDGREKLLGNEHPDTLASIGDQAFLLHLQKRYTDATTLYEKSSAGFQKALGANHPTTLHYSTLYSSMLQEMEASQDSKCIVN